MNIRYASILLASMVFVFAGCNKDTSDATWSQPKLARLVTSASFIYDEAPFPSAHASTIVETPAGMAAAWFGGTAERDPDVGIWFSSETASGWTPPVEVANGMQPDGTRYPTWNPVLFQAPDNGPLLLFYKAGPSPSEWWGLVRTSVDNGETWSEETRLPDGILGPIRAKPVLMADSSLLAGSSTEHDGWVVHMERLRNPRADNMWTLEYLADSTSWEVVNDLNDPEQFGAIQPTILAHSPTRLQILCRSVQGVVTEAWSKDGGITWDAMQETTLPNPSAGIDALRLQDGRFLLIYNPTREGREKLGLAVSKDGKQWKSVALLEHAAGEYSYPAMVQAADGSIHITYTWQREKIKYVVVDAQIIP
ncbi:MAG: sialidase family protein [Bacteroidota bacterium]